MDAPGHGDGAATVDDADDDGGDLVPFSVGSMARAKRLESHQERTQRSRGAKQRVTSSSVWQGRARSLPS